LADDDMMTTAPERRRHDDAILDYETASFSLDTPAQVPWMIIQRHPAFNTDKCPAERNEKQYRIILSIAKKKSHLFITPSIYL
jgi:hypothetical protein